MLKYKDVTYRQVSVWDLDKCFEQAYGVNPEIVMNEEWGNDAYFVYNVRGQLDRWNAERLPRLLAGEAMWYGTCRIVLEKLVIDGHLIPGDYLIASYW